MRLRAAAFAVAAFGAVAGGAWLLADAAARHLERQTRDELAAALAASGQDWASVAVDGLIVALGGEAPDETGRFRVIEIARQIVDGARVQDRITVAAASPLDPPAFALELLRNEDAISLIGLVPEAGGRAAIAAGLAAAGLGATVTDMLETAEHAAPEGWAASLAFGVGLIADLPRAKIRIGPGTVAVAAAAESDLDRATLTERLEAAVPPEVALSLDISAPRPVIAPFALAFHREPDGAGRLLACSAETADEAAVILAAARAAGLVGAGDCRLGLGAPTPDWAEAAALGIAAVAEMGGGGFSISDIEAVLTGPPGLDPGRLAAIGAGLGAALPPVFSLATRGAARVETEAGAAIAYAPEFRAVLLADGRVRLAGPVLDRTAQTAIVGVAEAIFGHERVINTTVLDPDLPEGWPGRVLAGVEALSFLKEGTLAVTADSVTVSGRSLLEDAGRELEAFFAAKGNGTAIIDVAFDARAAAAAAEAERPPEEACAEEIKAILARETILFEVGSATIDDDSAEVIAAIAAVLATCPGAAFEIGGHTDSQGRASVNQRLSDERAAAVLAALDAHGVPLIELTARGYGPDRPIADNDTEEGRALNRRIEFALIRAGDAGEADDGGAGEAEDGNEPY